MTGPLQRLRDWRATRLLDPSRFPEGPVRDLAAALPRTRDLLRETELLALDLETTGLDVATDHVLAIGWVPVRRGEVALGEAREVLVRPPEGAEVGGSATLHGLTDDVVATAAPLAEVLPQVLDALHGRVLVAHHAAFELRFLARMVREVHGCGLPLFAVDTLALQRRLVVDGHGAIAEGSLRLDAARRRFNLPRYTAHSAVTDAVAAAELLLAQAAEVEHRRDRPLRIADLEVVRP